MLPISGYGSNPSVYGYGSSAGDALAQHNEAEELKKAQDSAKNTTEGRKVANANGIKKNVDSIQ